MTKDRNSSPTETWGNMLKYYREAAGLTREQLAERVHFSSSHVTSVETGRRAPKDDFIQGVDAATGASGALIRLAETCLDHAGFMHGFEDWPDYERRATMLRGWESMLIPGLLQIREYVEAVLKDEEAAIQARLARQDVLAGDDPPVNRYVINDWVLHHQVGEPEVMVRQLDHLEHVAQEGIAYVQVLPADVLPGIGGAFALASVDGRTVGYEESTTQVRLLTGDQDLHRLEVMFHRLLAEADNPAKSLERIQKVRDEVWSRS